LSSEITHPGCRPSGPTGKATRYDGATQRAVYWPRGVKEPEHAWTLYVREPGELSGIRRRKTRRERAGKACGHNPVAKGVGLRTGGKPVR
ncbi:MAG: hypothetical protein Q7J09_01605, partial [Methanocalculus sp.]|uniref:hypothetical protein n=1 Tax=Methanocalculus sp. TaxID=2004547 RepID=UPI002718DF02